MADDCLRLAVLMTCHNRRETTLACLAALFAQEGQGREFTVTAYLADAGSTDGTAAAVSETHGDQARVISGSSALFWNGGTRVAWTAAMAGNHDRYLWLNDDTILHADAIRRLLAADRELAAHGPARIVVGSTRDPDTGNCTYGGVVRASRWHPFRHRLVTPTAEAACTCDTMNGNCVLVPPAVVERIGNLDPAFTHGMGDYDYGLRARAAGCGVWVAPGYYGDCRRNVSSRAQPAPGLSLRDRLARLNHPKGLPLREWRLYTRRHGGVLWLVFWLWPYVRAVLAPLICRSGRHGE